jgi:hypothetical protein
MSISPAPSPTACPPAPARTNSGAAGRLAAVAGMTTTCSAIAGPCGRAQSCRTQTFPHSAAKSSTVHAVSFVLGSNDDGADRDAPVPAQPAAASAATAVSAVRRNGWRHRSRGADAARATRLPAMVTTSSRMSGEPAAAAFSRPGLHGSLDTDRWPAGPQATGPNVPAQVRFHGTRPGQRSRSAQPPARFVTLAGAARSAPGRGPGAAGALAEAADRYPGGPAAALRPGAGAARRRAAALVPASR